MFLLSLLKLHSAKPSFFEINQIHVCFDSTYPLMEKISKSMSLGHYFNKGLHPYGYVKLPDGSIESTKIGRQTDYYKENRGPQRGASSNCLFRFQGT